MSQTSQQTPEVHTITCSAEYVAARRAFSEAAFGETKDALCLALRKYEDSDPNQVVNDMLAKVSE